MPLIETKGAASAQGFGEFLQQGSVNYIENVFSTYLYSGIGGTAQTITNNIDLSTKGGLVWTKKRSQVGNNVLMDTSRGDTYIIQSDTSNQQQTYGYALLTYLSSGYSLAGVGAPLNENGQTFVSWTFRKQPKFFDIVTYTGNNAARTISHNLGSTPGCVIIKCTNTAGTSWWVRHRSVTGNAGLLNSTSAFAFNINDVPTVSDTALSFASGGASTNVSGETYVAYLFAHNAGGFGLSGSDNVISCGAVTRSGSAVINVNLGYEPQWVLFKSASNSNNWRLFDNMRGMPVAGTANVLNANLADAEGGFSDSLYPTATGFAVNPGSGIFGGADGSVSIYIAIRRGPMKVPTSGTSVFTPLAEIGTGSQRTVNAGFPVDLFFIKDWTGLTGPTAGGNVFYDRLRGNSNVLQTQSTAAEAVSGTYTALFNSAQNGVVVGSTWSSYGYREYCFRRAPGFFDEVCYTGNGVSGRAINHNLTVAPNLMILKTRTSGAINDWWVYNSIQPSNYLILNTTDATALTSVWSNFTSTSFQIDNAAAFNASSVEYVAYLFATCPGVSKVGTYTGTGALQTIDCGFTGGARFVLIKRTDSTGDWYVYDSARGISSGNDSYLLLNSTAAEVTGTNYVDTTSVGFQVTAAAPAGLNANGGTYIFLAIA